MAEQGGDGLQAHAPVDGLGGESVAQLMGVDVADFGLACHPFDDAGKLVPLHRAPVIGDEAAVGADVIHVGCAPALEELDQLGMQRHEAVIAQLAHRNT